MLNGNELESSLPRPGETALCAVSGGLDSMCLLYLLHGWCKSRNIPLMAAHFNHELRPEASHDETFVRDWCVREGIPFTAGRGNVREYAQRKHLSIEEAARELRYAFLRRTAREAPFPVMENQPLAARNSTPSAWIYTAHHLNDNAETILWNLIRGSGVRGLRGMDRERNGIRRPFLDVTRRELEQYAKVHAIPHVEDSTNADPHAATRNRLRAEVLPLLRELNPKAAEHIHAAAAQLAVLDRFAEQEARERLADLGIRKFGTPERVMERLIVPIELLWDAPEAIRPRMLLYALETLGAGRKDIGAVHLNALERLCVPDSGPERRYPPHGGPERRLNLPHGVTAHCRRGELILEKRVRTLTETVLPPGQPVPWGPYVLTLYVNDNIPGNQTGLFLRGPRHKERGNGTESCVVSVIPCPSGARLTLPGANGSRSVKRLCLDRGIPLTERDSLPALRVDGILAAVWRIGTDTAFCPEPGESRRFVSIEPLEQKDFL